MEKPSSFLGRNKKGIAWTIRIIIFGLFTLSAVAKMFPLWAFEKQLVDLGICSWCTSHYLARFVIGFELALGLAILLPHLLKKLVIPTTILLLVAFCGHLIIQMIEYGPMNGNCGCFGQLIPMTPLEAFIKNILTIGLLIWLYKLLSSENETWKDIIYPIAIFLASALFMFAAFPFTPCGKEAQAQTANLDSEIDNLNLVDINEGDDSLNIESTDPMMDTNAAKKMGATPEDNIQKNKGTAEKLADNKSTTAAKSVADPTTEKVEKGPAPKKSKFAAFPVFNGKKINIDGGKKVICLFAPGCDHCQHTAKEIGELAKTNKIPEVYIYFMDEETEKIPEFFKIAGVKYPYQVLGIGDFWTLLGNGSTPGVFLQHNGNTIKSFEGINENEFDMKEFKKFAISK